MLCGLRRPSNSKQSHSASLCGVFRRVRHFLRPTRHHRFHKFLHTDNRGSCFGLPSQKFGYRRICVAAHVFSTVGLVALAILPFVFSDAFWGIAISSFTMAIGGGILEVAISPLIEAIPSDNKEKEMSLLHSFYCWGHVGVVLVSTGFIWLFGIQNWRYLPLFWTILPILNSFLFHKVQLWDICPGEKGLSLKELFKMPIFYVFVALMICSGASEQAVGQWSSFFAEKGLGLSKTTADVLGTCAFAVCMGSSRLIYSLFSEKYLLKSPFSQAVCYAPHAF